ncbi:hypothetical protein WOC76_04380 [Methylocystis sp. IM3]|uniref:hypothetical protein n=1 Tax=unclassified Methylocystis TaxID=2625913 RepID=UPI0030F89B99
MKATAPTIAQRLIVGGFLSIAELCQFKGTSKSVVYEDIAAGLLPVEKFGRATRIAGPVARDYIPRRGVVKTEAAA